MADIKASDISISQTISSNDLILGSSINGTTANITVETLGKYLIDSLNLSSLSNQSVSDKIIEIETEIDNFFTRRFDSASYTASSTNWEYTGHSISVPSGHTYLLVAVTSYQTAKPVGVLFSSSPTVMNSYGHAYIDNSTRILRSPVIMLTGGETAYLWEKRDVIPSGPNTSNFMYYDILNV